MNSKVIGAIRLAQVSPTNVAPRRLAGLARNRLQGLGIPSFVTDDMVRGRVDVSTCRLDPWDGIGVESKQEFVVQGHDRLWFIKPSILRFIGAVPFYDARSKDELLGDVGRRWAALQRETRSFLDLARRYFPNVRLVPETWTLDVDVKDQFGTVNLRVRPYQGRVWVEVVGTDGAPLSRPPSDDRLISPLPDDPALFDRLAIEPLLQRVRAGATPKAAEAEPMELELDLSLSEDIAPRVDDDASLDLALLITGDLATDPPVLELEVLGEDALQEVVEPMPVRLSRLKTTPVPVVLSTAQATLGGIVRDLNRGGIFVELDDPEQLALDSLVFVSGIGSFAVRGRVCHIRSLDEGTLLGTGSGVGLELVDAPVPRRDGPNSTVLILTDTDRTSARGARFAAIVVGAARIPILARDLTEALLALRALPIRGVVLDQSFLDYGPRELDAAFGFDGLGADLVVVAAETDGEVGPGVTTVAPDQLSTHLVTNC